MAAGQYVLVTGHYRGGRAQVRAVTQDPLFSNPAGYFGAAVNHLVLQGFVRVADGTVFLNGQKIAAGPGVSGKPGADRVAIVSLERKPDGNFIAVGLRYIDRDDAAPGAIRVPAGTSRGPATAPPQAGPSTGQMMALTGNGSLPNAGPTAANMTTMGEPAATSPAVTTGSAGALTNDPATTSAPSVNVAETPPSSAPPRPVITPTPISTIPPAVDAGAAIERLTPTTSQLMSRHTGPTDALRPVAHTVVTFHPAIAAAASTNVLLSTEAVTTPPAQTGAGSVKTPVALSLPSSRSGDIMPTGSGQREAPTGGIVSRSH